MIIFGWRTRLSVLWQGWFACPYERAQRMARVREARRWFTLFFIPVIPLAPVGRAVECSGCGLSFDERVLSHAPRYRTPDTQRTEPDSVDAPATALGV